jgi:hypothetical protein
MSGGSPGSPSTHRALCCAPSARPTSSTVVCNTLDNSSELRMAVAMRLTAISRRACSWSRRASFVVTATVSCSEVAFGTLVRTAFEKVGACAGHSAVTRAIRYSSAE